MQTIPITASLLDNWEQLFVTAKEWGDILDRPLSLKYDAMLSLIDAARQNAKLIEAVDALIQLWNDDECPTMPFVQKLNTAIDAVCAARGPKGVVK
jgi:hypothetical protein